MRVIVAFICFAVLALANFGDASYYTKYSGDKVYRVTPMNAEQLDLLKALVPHRVHKGSLDFWKRPTVIGMPVDVHVRRFFLERFERFLSMNQFHSEVHVDDLQKMINTVDTLNMHLKAQANNSIVGTFASQADINTWLSQQCQQYPNITDCGSWGLSFEGRDMRYIHISKKPIGPVKPKYGIYIESGMHAREWLGPATIVWIINQLLTQYGKDQTITTLVTNYDWYFQPVTNPDGYEYSRSQDRMWRKTRSPTTDSQCPGVDGNRNFDYEWQGGGDPCDEDYPGTAAMTEKEVQNMAKFMAKQNKTQHGLAYFSVHTYSQDWLLPWGYAQGAYPDDYDEELRVAKIGADALMATHNTRWQVGNIVDLLYVAAGNTADFFKGHGYVKYSFALELRGNNFIVPASQIVPSGQEVFAGFVAAVKAMQQP